MREKIAYFNYDEYDDDVNIIMLDLFVNLRNPAVYPAGCYYIIENQVMGLYMGSPTTQRALHFMMFEYKSDTE